MIDKYSNFSKNKLRSISVFSVLFQFFQFSVFHNVPPTHDPISRMNKLMRLAEPSGFMGYGDLWGFVLA